jgi:hypothetical protein
MQLDVNSSEPPMLVQLTRMEGVLNAVAEKVGDLRGHVDRHEVEISALQLTTQQLASDARAKDLTVLATAKALADAKTASDAAARAESDKADAAWSPTMRVLSVIGGFAALAGVVLAAYLAGTGH